MTGSEEHLSEYFVAIQKVLHDIAAKLTDTHHLTCHNALAAARGKRLRIDDNTEEEENEDGHAPEEAAVFSEGGETGRKDSEEDDVFSSE